MMDAYQVEIRRVTDYVGVVSGDPTEWSREELVEFIDSEIPKMSLQRSAIVRVTKLEPAEVVYERDEPVG